MADRIPDEVQDRIHHALDQVLVDLRRLTLQFQRDFLVVFTRQIADHERHAPENFANRHQADPHDAFAQPSQLSIDRLGVFLDGAPFRRRHVPLEARQRVRQAGAADHQVADALHQFVEAREVHADHVRG